MIIEARCSECDKRIGHALITGDTNGLEETKYVKKISNSGMAIILLCDKCRDGMIDFDERKPWSNLSKSASGS